MATVPRTADEIDALWDYDDPPGSERRFRELLPYYAVDAAHMLAIVSSGEEQLDWNRRGLAMAAGSDDPRARGWKGSLYNNLGWTHHERGLRSLGRVEDALRMQRELQAELERSGEKDQHVVEMIAACLTALGRAGEAPAGEARS